MSSSVIVSARYRKENCVAVFLKVLKLFLQILKLARGCLCLQKTSPLDLMIQGNPSRLREEKLQENKKHHQANKNSQNRQRTRKLSKVESGPLADWCPGKSLQPPQAIRSIVRRVVIPWGRLLRTLLWFLLGP